jgi:hypothetical protein
METRTTKIESQSLRTELNLYKKTLGRILYSIEHQKKEAYDMGESSDDLLRSIKSDINELNGRVYEVKEQEKKALNKIAVEKEPKQPKTFTAILVNTNGEITPVTPKNNKDFTLAELQGFVGGLIEVYPVGDRFYVWNEEGRINGMPVNKKATELLFNDLKIPIFDVMGNVIICKKSQLK